MIRYAITHVGDNGRQLTFANDGKNHYTTREEAENMMKAYEPDLRSKVLKKKANTLKVMPVDCYENGDAKGIYFS